MSSKDKSPIVTTINYRNQNLQSSGLIGLLKKSLIIILFLLYLNSFFLIGVLFELSIWHIIELFSFIFLVIGKIMKILKNK